jgi:hypothetical protein
MGRDYVLAVTCVQDIVSALEQDQGSTTPPPGVVDCRGEFMCPTSLVDRLRPTAGYDLVARSAERHHTLGDPSWRKPLFTICLVLLGVFETMQEQISDGEAYVTDENDDYEPDPFILRERPRTEGSHAFAAMVRLLGLSWCDEDEGDSNCDDVSWPWMCVAKFLLSGEPTAPLVECRLLATGWF